MNKLWSIICSLTVLCAALSTCTLPTAKSASPSGLQSTAEDHSTPFPIGNFAPVRKIACTKGNGTGFMISDDIMITAQHVIQGSSECHDAYTNEPLTPIYQSYEEDFAVLRVPPMEKPKKKLKITCAGFTPGKVYYSIGFVGDLIVTRVRATDQIDSAKDYRTGTPFRQVRVLNGLVIPGMSGGPIIDPHGRVVGINNATRNKGEQALSREMKDTYFCQPRYLTKSS